MSMPKDFSEDGAAGAGGPPQGTSGTFGNSSASQGGAIPSNWMANGALAPNGYGGVWDGTQITADQASQKYGAGAVGDGALQGLGFEGGGSIPDADGDQDGDQDGGAPAMPAGGGSSDRIALALATVDSALSYGRSKHGLPADSDTTDSNQPQQMAQNRLPSVPGTQSESGIKPVQPMPGPLPPTANPFGKRTMGANEPGDGEDTQPTIPTDDGDEETA